jgi:diketogulonate reductase-like aldo/keto reductase
VRELPGTDDGFEAELSPFKIDYIILFSKRENRPTMNKVRLNNGVEMPMVGMGTFSLNGLRLGILIWKAVRVGYTSFDTGSAYLNEKWLGRGIRFCGKNRKNLFITSKLSNRNQRRGNIRKALLNSLSRLGLDYLDLYLMHWPNPETYLDSWKQMEKLYKEGNTT